MLFLTLCLDKVVKTSSPLAGTTQPSITRKLDAHLSLLRLHHAANNGHLTLVEPALLTLGSQEEVEDILHTLLLLINLLALLVLRTNGEVHVPPIQIKTAQVEIADAISQRHKVPLGIHQMPNADAKMTVFFKTLITVRLVSTLFKLSLFDKNVRTTIKIKFL